MNTDELISGLVTDLSRPSASTRQVLPVLLPLSLVAALLSFKTGLHIRPDIWVALESWRYLAKFAVGGSVAVVGFSVLLRMARPEQAPSRSLPWLSLALLPLLLAVAAEVIVLPPAEWGTKAIGFSPLSCISLIALISLLPLIASLAALRRGAPRSPTLAGAVAGFSASGSGAFIYALHCVDDSPLYVAIWYLGSIVAVTLLGAAGGRYILRW